MLFSAAGRAVSRDRANTKPKRVECALLMHKSVYLSEKPKVELAPESNFQIEASPIVLPHSLLKFF